MKNLIFLTGVLLLLGAISFPAQAQTYRDAQGFYGQFSVPIGWNNMAGPSEFGTTDGTMAGFSFNAGYRFNGWVGADVEVMWLGGGDVVKNGAANADASLLSVGAAIKFYPFVLTSRYVPGWIQPYVAFGLGSGIFEQTLRGSPAFGSSLSETVFLFRIGVGMEVMISKHWGTFIESNYYASNSNSISGIGMIRLGAMCHF
ncbi:MAG TPA: porin family protein [Myxococcales bacterium]|nr:porin family protein [Myxococcales bacterium]HIL01622.1 porin family protein [Myxococcales bacterium]